MHIYTYIICQYYTGSSLKQNKDSHHASSLFPLHFSQKKITFSASHLEGAPKEGSLCYI